MKKNIQQLRKKRRINRTKKIDLPAGSLIYFGDKDKSIDIDVISYNENNFNSQKAISTAQALSLISEKMCTWININGLNTIDEIRKIGEFTKLHNLLLEDVIDTEHRPKCEITDDNILIINKMIYHREDGQLTLEHLAILLGKDYVITFQEADGGDVFEPLRKRLQMENTNIRKRKTDYLLFALLDAVIDNYLVVLDRINLKIEEIEDEVITNPREDIISEIQAQKKGVIFLQKSMLPLREVVGKFDKIEHHLITSETKHYFRDLQDHTIHIAENLATYREILWG